MESNTSQVQKRKPKFAEAGMLDLRYWMELYLGSPGWGLIRKTKKGKRLYPGENEANFVLSYLESLAKSSSRQTAFVKLLRSRPFDEGAVLRRLVNATNGGKWAFDIGAEGIVLLPTEPEGIAAMGLLVLSRRRSLNRIRECRHCKSWFYARFKHQRFCTDQEKKCQWNYYHTPKWRKRNRKRNLEHQRAYRERNPGRGRT